MSTANTTTTTIPPVISGIGGTPVAGTSTITAPVTATPATTTITPGPQAPSMNFRQLDDLCKKYINQIVDQEKEFIDLATKINYWDKILQTNSEKIEKMSESLKAVKRDHGRMLTLIDEMKDNQKVFEQIVEYAEAHVPDATVPMIPERAELYGSVENVQVNLQQIAENLKEIVRLANASNKLSDRTDPVSQILRILNEHTDSLQWIDTTTNGMVDSIENVSKIHQVYRRDHERSLRLMFKPN